MHLSHCPTHAVLPWVGVLHPIAFFAFTAALQVPYGWWDVGMQVWRIAAANGALIRAFHASQKHVERRDCQISVLQGRIKRVKVAVKRNYTAEQTLRIPIDSP